MVSCISHVDRFGISQALGVSQCLVKLCVPARGRLIPGQTHPEKNLCCLLCSQFGLGPHDGSLSLIKLSVLFEAGTTGLTEKQSVGDCDQPGSP